MAPLARGVQALISGIFAAPRQRRSLSALCRAGGGVAYMRRTLITNNTTSAYLYIQALDQLYYKLCSAVSRAVGPLLHRTHQTAPLMPHGAIPLPSQEPPVRRRI